MGLLVERLMGLLGSRASATGQYLVYHSDAKSKRWKMSTTHYLGKKMDGSPQGVM